jgi:hypothetical protein
VRVQQAPVITNLDLYAVVGRDDAYDRATSAVVSDGIPAVDFSAKVGSAEVNAIEVYSCSAPAPIPTATATPLPTATATALRP